MSYQNYFSQALKNIYGKKRQQGYQPGQGYGGFVMAMPKSAPRINFRTPIGQGYGQQNQGYGGFMGQGYSGLNNPLMASPISEALTPPPRADMMQNMPTQPQTSPISEALNGFQRDIPNYYMQQALNVSTEGLDPKDLAYMFPEKITSALGLQGYQQTLDSLFAGGHLVERGRR